MGRRRKSGHNLPPRVYHHHGQYFYVDRSQKWHPLGADLKEAKRQWAVLSENPETYGTVAWWLDAFIVHRRDLVKAKKLAASTVDGNAVEAVFLKAFFGKMTPGEVHPADVGLYLERRGTVAPVRANRERALLSAMFTWLMLRRAVSSNPCRGVRRNPEKPRERIIEDWEYSKVYDRAKAANRTPAVWRLMVLIYRTAQRPEDVLSYTPRSVRTVQHEGIQTSVLRVPQGKTGKTVDIVLTGELDDVVREAMGDVVKLDRPFICKRNGKRFTYDGISGMFRRHVKACGITDFGLYDLRGKAATDLYRDGTPLERIQNMLGHESITTTEIYIKARLPGVVMPNERLISGKEQNAPSEGSTG